MVKLVFARHGESEWNKANLFTGWADVDLSEKGTQQAIDAGKLIKEAGIEFDKAYTSVLKRAIKTTNLAPEASDQLWVPVEKSWRLNERHYGGLTGKNKAEAAEQFGDEQVHIWRRSYDVLPPAMDRDDEHSAHTDRRYASLDDSVIPDAENLKVTLERALPFWEDKIAPALKDDLIYNYGIIRCKKSEFNTVSPDDYVCCRETNLSVECLIHDKVAAKKRYQNLIIDNASIEDIMLFYIKGGVK